MGRRSWLIIAELKIVSNCHNLIIFRDLGSSGEVIVNLIFQNCMQWL